MPLAFGLAVRRGIVYEGDCNSYMRAIHPMPSLTEARCDIFKAEAQRDLIFREDLFDPVTRIRRGRFYRQGGQPNHTIQSSRICNYPYGELMGISAGGFDTNDWYQAIVPHDVHRSQSYVGTQVILGEDDFQTIWRVVDIEKISSGDLLCTLKSVAAFGALPALKGKLLDQTNLEVDLSRVQRAIDKLVDALHVQQPVPIVDVARDAAKVILTSWIGTSAHGKDLSGVVSLIPPPDAGDERLIKSAAKLIARLHSRGKTSEHERRGLRPIIDQDAELSVHLVGFLLHDLSWSAS